MLLNSVAGKVAYNTVAQLLGKAITVSASLFITILLTRFLGKEGFGNYSLIISFPTVLYLVTDFGLNAIAVREYRGRTQAIAKIFSHLISLRFIFSLLSVLAVYIIVPFTPYPAFVKLGILFAVFAVFFQPVSTSVNSVFQTKLRYDFAALSLLFGSFLAVFFVGLGVAQNFSLLYFILVYLLEIFGIAAASVYFLARFKIALSFGIDFQILKKLFWASLPLGLMLVFAQINNKADVFLLSVLSLPRHYGLSGSETVGIYHLSYAVFANLLVFPTFFMNALYPIFISDYGNDFKQFISRFKKAFIILFCISLILTTLALLFAPLVIAILGGREFTASVASLRILSLGIPFFFITSPLQWALVTAKREKILPWVYFSAALFNLGANLVFIPRYSYLASSWISVASEGLIFILLALAGLGVLGEGNRKHAR